MKKKSYFIIAIIAMFLFSPISAQAAGKCYYCTGSFGNIYKWQANGITPSESLCSVVNKAESECINESNTTVQSSGKCYYCRGSFGNKQYWQEDGISPDETLCNVVNITQAACGKENNTSEDQSSGKCYYCTGSFGNIYKWQANGITPSESLCNVVNVEKKHCYNKSNKTTAACGDVTGIPAALPVFCSNIINAIKVLVPVLLIIMGMIDFLKATMASDEKQIKEAQSKFVRRLLAGVIIFFVVAIVQFVFSAISKENEGNFIDCFDCFMNGDCTMTDGGSNSGINNNTSDNNNNTSNNGGGGHHISADGHSHGGGGHSR